MEPAIAQKSPYKVELEAGKTVWWCACGQSASQPYCDGSHRGTGFAPVSYTPAESGTAWLCGCKKTATQPLCDGTHRGL
jgi:CDGSH-type Zn-finger protein